MKKLLIPLLSLALAGGFAPYAHATLSVYEGFNYPNGSNVEGQNGGTGWAGAWEYQAFYSTNVTGSLSYTDSFGNILITSGNKLYCAGDTAGNNSSQPARTTATYYTNYATSGTGTTNWLSFLYQRIGTPTGTGGPGGTPTYERGANMALFDTNVVTPAFPGQERLDIGENSSVIADCVMLRAPATAAPNPVTAVVNAVSTNSITNLTLVVLRFDFVSNVIDIVNGDNLTNDNVFIWVNPPLGTVPSIASATTNIIGQKDFSFNRFRLFAGGLSGSQANAEMYMDEIRIGDTFADVTPYTPASGGNLTARWTNVVATGNNIALTLTGKVSTVYRVVGATNLTQSPWNIIGNLTTDANGVGNITDTGVLVTQPRRFYGVDTP